MGIINMQIKEGVSLLGISPQIAFAIPVIQGCTNAQEVELVVTCATDSRHKRGSKHYTGHAIDIRTRDMKNDLRKQQCAEEIRDCLGSEFDVVLHSTHIHIEWDPKLGPNLDDDTVY